MTAMREEAFELLEKMPEDKLILEAKRWEMRHGGLSGRTAQQFINYVLYQNDEI